MTEADRAGTRILVLVPDDSDANPPVFAGDARTEVRDIYRLADLDLGDYCGLYIGGMCDQRYLARRSEQLRAFVAGGGRLLLNGHVIEQVLPGLPRWRKLPYSRPADLVIERAAAHPIWEGVDADELLFRTGVPGPHQPEELACIGVAGFYGRGYAVDLPPGARVINTIGQLRAPIDDAFPIGAGEVVVHAGLDLTVFAATPHTTLRRLGPNMLAWLGGDQ